MTHSQLLKLSHQHPVVVFDGVCVLCNGFIQWLLDKDVDQIFRYVSLQDFESSQTSMDSVLLYDQGLVYSKSDVSMQVVSRLQAPYKWLSLLRWVPQFIRDAIYTLIAKNRYRWFGKNEQCMIPTQAQQKLFIS